jgi:hypothetical protein
MIPVLFSQQTGLAAVMETESWLKSAFTSLYNETSDSIRTDLNKEIISRFGNILKSKDSFYYPWAELNMIGKVRSQDEKINIFTWHIEKKQNEFEYYGILQITEGKKKEKEPGIYILHDKSKDLKNPETLKLDPDQWYGAIYFGIHTYRFKRNSYYTLFGYDYNSLFSRKKILEVLMLDKSGVPSFAGVFQMQLQKIKRVIFEYSSEVVMSMRFDPKIKMIVVDHLSPFDPILTNNYRFYAPDGSYDAFKFDKGVFILHTDVDARNF